MSIISKTEEEQLYIITQQITIKHSKVITTITNINMDESYKHNIKERNENI